MPGTDPWMFLSCVLTLHCSTNLGPANKQPRSIEHLLSRVWVPMVSRHFVRYDGQAAGWETGSSEWAGDQPVQPRATIQRRLLYLGT